ncbi:DUF1885 family protein [Brevibacillus dissolubilis]|uniref:DUF1885 family protein n=1 Tax=Brevibacillus dissolubilis TaxID=1844116 RepID=UPI00111713E8|nr:DUF1885 family protein [Brevibacillus dissolubilis]
MNMQSAYIYLVEGSSASAISLADVKTLLQGYIDKMKKLGEQLGWAYGDAAFPYVFDERPEGKDAWFLLRGRNPDEYKNVVIGVGSTQKNEKELPFIQITLPEASTHGDKSKANEYCRYLARELKAELHLFNGRVQYFQPRKP